MGAESIELIVAMILLVWIFTVLVVLGISSDLHEIARELRTIARKIKEGP